MVRNLTKRLILLCSFFALMLIGVLLIARHSTEPVIESRRLGKWLEDAQIDSGESKERAEKAIIAAGSNAIPFLVSELTTVHSPLHESFLSWVCRQPWLFPVRRTLGIWRDPSEESHRARAKNGFRLLGFDAGPAFPLLTNALMDNETALPVTEVLASCDDHGKLLFGPRVGAPLIAMIKHENPGIRRLAINAVGLSQTNVEVAVPALVAAFDDRDGSVRSMAVMSVGGAYKQERSVTVPALIRAMDDASVLVRTRAMLMLGFYGKLAEPALPKLEAAAKDSDAQLSESAKQAIARIRP